MWSRSRKPGARSRGVGPVLGAGLVLLFNLFWFGWYISFPLFGEDGAAAYSSLVETLRASSALKPVLPVKWLEGLGQADILANVNFDPFSWVMYLRLEPGHAFRLSYALRSTACWLTSFLLVRALFRGVGGIAAVAASLTVLLAFILPQPFGVPTFSVMHVATHSALFPLLAWLYLRLLRSRPAVGGAELGLALTLGIFLPIYPFGALLGVAVLLAFGLAVWATARGGGRRRAAVAMLKVLVILLVLLFAPTVGIYRTWRAVAAVSARAVFAGELTSYGREYIPPQFWHDVPLGIRVVVLLALAIVLVGRRWPRPIRALMLTLAIVVGAAQIATVVRWSGVASAVMDRLPRPFYLEFYLPPFYAACAAYTLARLRTAWSGQRHASPGLSRVLAFAGASWLLVGGWVLWPGGLGPASARAASRARRWGRWGGPAAALVLFLGAFGTWSLWPEGLHPLFAPYLVCREHGLFCRDGPGVTMGAAANPITEFLTARVGLAGEFRGRADFLLADRFSREDEVWIMVQERDRNFLATGNGMLLRALPFQGVPVASSYEQSLDYLYYLLWTRYVNHGVAARRSINMTNLDILRRDRLALIGVRYVVATDQWYDFTPHLSRAFAYKGYSIWDVGTPNVAGYGPTRPIFARTLADELRALRAPDFDPRRDVVLDGEERPWLGTGPALAPLTASRLIVKRQSLVFEATGGPGRTLAVLPFKFSRCWRPRWDGPVPGRIVRADVALLGVAFAGATRVRLSWSAGYGPGTRCLERDAELVPAAIVAASEVR